MNSEQRTFNGSRLELDAVRKIVRPHPSPLPQEREQEISAPSQSRNSESLPVREHFLPLLGGEGWGEGERIFSTKLFPLGILVTPLILFLLTGCTGDHFQSALHPASPEAREISRLWWFMFIVCGAVFAAVIGLLIFAIARRGERNSQAPGGDTKFVVIGGMIIPGIILFVLLVYSVSAKVFFKSNDKHLTIEVIGHRWWWEVRYPNQDIVIANEIYIPAGKPVRLQLRSADVIHSFWVPNLHGKMDMLVEHTNTLWIQADKPGVYRGQCAEFCGAQHAWMAFELVALSPNDFDNWIAERRRFAIEQAASAERKRGHEIFMRVGCGQCHAIKETSAVTVIGPDLTHFGSRRTIGAGLATNSVDNLTRWILEPQKMKPGNLMPHTALAPDDLAQLVEYLASLK